MIFEGIYNNCHRIWKCVISTGEQVTGIAETSGFIATFTTEKEAKFQLEVVECKDVFFSSNFTDLNSVWSSKSNGERLIAGTHIIIGPNYHYLQSSDSQQLPDTD